MSNLIQVQNLHFKRNKRKIFQGASLDIPQGKITAIMGPSGTGKTTLLRLIGGQLAPQRGSVLINGINVHKISRTELYKLRQSIGMLFQSGGLFTHLNVFENVAFPLREHTKLSESMIRTLVLTKLQMVGLRGARNLMPSDLSGGMARRVGLARAVALDPELIMYDEPFTGQDPISMGVLIKLIKTLNDSLNLTTVIVSHDVSEVLSIADMVYVIADGKVIGKGTSRNIQHADNAAVEQFLEGLPDGPVPFHYPAISIQKDLMENV